MTSVYPKRSSDVIQSRYIDEFQISNNFILSKVHAKLVYLTLSILIVISSLAIPKKDTVTVNSSAVTGDIALLSIIS